MYERFTDRARKTMQLANQEAQRFNHEYIDAEHVLIGLAKEGSGVACSILSKEFKVDVSSFIRKTRDLMTAGPDMVTMGKLPQTVRCKLLISNAIEYAKSMGHNHVGTEHLLLGLLLVGDGIVEAVMRSTGLTLAHCRSRIRDIVPQDAPASPLKRGRAFVTEVCQALGMTSERIYGVRIIADCASSVTVEVLQRATAEQSAKILAAVSKAIPASHCDGADEPTVVPTSPS